MSDASFWRGRRVFLTGHTGFKGGWLALLLARAGAEVHGYALAPATRPDLFGVAGIRSALAAHTIADVRDAVALRAAFERAAPEVVFHLAAQPLVRASYRDPVETYATNVMGTVHLLDTVRTAQAPVRAVVNVTSDKCYADDARPIARREGDALGGHDPYASSKACAELVSAAYRDAFLAGRGIGLATARAGNVIGGGDWAEDRLLPDVLRALDTGRAVAIRHPQAIRPWQHVLEPLEGYLMLAERLVSDATTVADAWNFGPDAADARPVAELLDHIAARRPAFAWERAPGPHPHETPTLLLDSARARTLLGWRPRWNVADALDRTLEWHAAWRGGADMHAFCLAQIEDHAAAAARATTPAAAATAATAA